MKVYVPYSPRSFSGITSDVLRAYSGATIVPIVLKGEAPPQGYEQTGNADIECPHIIATPAGEVEAFYPRNIHQPQNDWGWFITSHYEIGKDDVVIANGGVTAQTVCAVMLALTNGRPLVNLQRDGSVKMAIPTPRVAWN
jgi:hypothetical protein